MLNLNIWINVANILYLMSYSVRDILWLRILTVTGILCLLPYFYLQPTPMMVPIYWNLIFFVINVYWIIRLFLERRPVKLSPNEQKLYQLTFRSLTPREALKLFQLGAWRSVDKGEVLAELDKEIDSLSIVLTGSAEAKVGGRIVAEVGVGQCVGQIAFFTENKLAVADVITTEPTVMMTWPITTLHKITMSHPELSTAIRMALGADISMHLMKTWDQKSP